MESDNFIFHTNSSAQGKHSIVEGFIYDIINYLIVDICLFTDEKMMVITCMN